MTDQTALRARTAPATEAGRRLTFPRALHSEWIKTASVRSTWWSIGIAAVLTLGIAALIANTAAPVGNGFDPITAVVLPSQFTMLVAGVLGAIAVSGEYSTGMIRSTLTANPVRGSVLAAKTIVLGMLLFVSSLVTFVVAALLVGAVIAPHGLAIDWADPSASVFPILVASASMAAFAVIGVAFGFILRSGAGAIAATVGLLFVLPVVASLFQAIGSGAEWLVRASQYLPSTVAQGLLMPGMSGVDAPVAALTLVAWVAAGLLAAWAVLRTRDA